VLLRPSKLGRSLSRLRAQQGMHVHPAVGNPAIRSNGDDSGAPCDLSGLIGSTFPVAIISWQTVSTFRTDPHASL
jgi:hypothetical protein